MSHLDRLIPRPRLREVDHVDVAVPPVRAREVLRNLDLARSPLVSALFSLRTIPARLRGEASAPRLRIDDIAAQGTGFHMLADDADGFVIGSIGRFWEPAIPFAAIPPNLFAAFDEAGWGKLAWEVRFEPRGDAATRVVIELRVTATDDDSWRHFRQYFRWIGPFSRFIRRHMLELVHRELGDPESQESARALPGDDRLPSAKGQATHGITIDATPEAIWPWLVQMGCRRAGWYSYDRLDNGGTPSARRVVPELQQTKVGDELPATPDGEEGFVVERLEPNRLLLLHGLYDLDAGKRVDPANGHPARFWEVSWAFVLEPLDAKSTRLVVRVRVDFAPAPLALRLVAMRPVHAFMEKAQLRHLKLRAEGRMPKHVDTARDVGEGVIGALGMLLDLGTPFLRGARSHWGLRAEEAARAYPGDERIAQPSWSWTHAVTIDAPAARVWPWVVQIGQDKAGFYSYQWLENMVGCDVQNADAIHPEWQTLRVRDAFRIHPTAPPLEVAEVAPGRYFFVDSELDSSTGEARSAEHPERYVRVTWLFYLEPLDGERCRLVSRYRVAYGNDLLMHLTYGPLTVESIGFMMDRRMLLGVKERAERERRGAASPGAASPTAIAPAR